MEAVRIFRNVILSCILIASSVSGSAQSRYLRALELNTSTQKWEFQSIDMDSELSTVVSQLPDTLTPLGNGTVSSFNPSAQQYFFIAETPAPSTRYLVTLDGFSGTVLQAVPAPGIFAIYANRMDGFVYGLRHIAVSQVVKISPVNGLTTAVTNNLNFLWGFSVNGSALVENNNELWMVGQQPMNNGVIARVKLNAGTVQLSDAPTVRLVRHDLVANKAYSISRLLNPLRFTLDEISVSDPSLLTSLNDSLPIQTLNGEVAMINPFLKEMYVRVLIPNNSVPQMAMINLNTGTIFKFLPVPASKNGFAFTPFPPNLRTHTLSGTVYLDMNANGQQDANEIGISNQGIMVQPGGYTLLSNQTGRYSVKVPDGSYTVTPTPTSLYYVSSLPLTYSFSFQSGNQIESGLDFGLSLFTNEPEDKITISVSPTPARVGRDVQHTITVKNDGGTVLDVTVTYQEGEHISVTSTSQPPTGVNNGVYTFEVTDLLPGEERTINVILSTPPDPNLMGQINTATVTATAQSQSGETSDQKIVSQPILNSYDPNDILVFGVQDTTLNAGAVLEYTIRFQNTGNDTAFKVMIVDSLPLTALKLETIQMKGASHPYYFEVDPNGIAIWEFPDILLPDSNTNYIGSNGFVSFSVELKESLAPLLQVRNRAGIYFDFNPPIITNDATVQISDLLSVNHVKDGVRMSLYPNPTDHLLHVHVYVTGKENLNLSLMNLQGQTLFRQKAQASGVFKTEFDCSQLAKGVYLIQVKSETWAHTRKVVVN